MLGARDKDDPVLPALVEPKTRFEIMLMIGRQDQPNVDQAMHSLYKQLGE